MAALRAHQLLLLLYNKFFYAGQVPALIDPVKFFHVFDGSLPGCLIVLPADTADIGHQLINQVFFPAQGFGF